MGKITYSVQPKLIGFSNKSVAELKKRLDRKGYKYRQPQLGGGPSPEVIPQVVAWLNDNSFFASIFLIVATSVTKKVYVEVKDWYRKNPPNPVKNLKVKNYVHFSFWGRKRSFDFELDISKKYSNDEIKTIIKNSKRENK